MIDPNETSFLRVMLTVLIIVILFFAVFAIGFDIGLRSVGWY